LQTLGITGSDQHTGQTSGRK